MRLIDEFQLGIAGALRILLLATASEKNFEAICCAWLSPTGLADTLTALSSNAPKIGNPFFFIMLYID